ncbi:hypothetical protein [Streptacidiphilus sp. P02-A3a]|uniref:hypothetical protein n=1 Tax=Streptacidiphilus sp. P02-A3a TaxID=2704468 RepID=UPI0015FE45C0|nr:hypothetical protein [Streptacidiphilus sp. P02-A3a]QMU68072.1 hypothetical protein GXP74_07400 [Streptacidiphilus sp. P02-A3a]
MAVTSTYRLTRAQQKNRFTILGVMAVVMAVGWTAITGGHRPSNPWGLGLFEVPFALFLLLVALDALSRSVVGDAGITLRRPWWRSRYSWQEIADIEVFTESARGSSTTRVRIRTVQGKRRKLPAPMTSGMYRSSVDPEFAAKVQQIRDRWQAAVAASPVSEDADR